MRVNSEQNHTILLLGKAGATWDTLATINKMGRLARKHHRQCENSCNGEGWYRGEFYRAGSLVAPHMKSAYVRTKDGQFTVFDVEIERLEKSIKMLCLGVSLNVQFQHDPRGFTVSLVYIPANQSIAPVNISCLLYGKERA